MKKMMGYEQATVLSSRQQKRTGLTRKFASLTIILIKRTEHVNINPFRIYSKHQTHNEVCYCQV